MKSGIFLTLSLIGYIAFIVCNVYKLKDIARNPQQYETVKGKERYRKSFWYESGYKRYGKNYHAGLILFIPFMLLLPLLYLIFGFLVQRYLLIPAEATYLCSTGLFIGVLGAQFFTISLSQIVLFYVNAPIFVAARLYCAGCTVKSDSDDYLKAWKKSILVLLVIGIICLPILAIGINAYSYADEDKIVTHGVFSLQEKQIPYDMVISRETSYSYDEEDDTFEFQYIIVLSDGKEMDLYDFGPRGVCYIDTMLNRHNVIISHGRVDKDTYEQMKSVCDEMSLKFVDQCLIVDG